MLQKEWPILIVDDAPDVLAVTRLVLKDVQVDAVPVKLQTANSKAEAIQLFSDAPGPPGTPSFAVALSPALQLLHVSYLKLLATLAKAGATAPQSRSAV